jgi:hypothetical protein
VGKTCVSISKYSLPLDQWGASRFGVSERLFAALLESPVANFALSVLKEFIGLKE